MRVVKRGRPKDTTFHGDCPHCESVIEADREDDRLVLEYDQRDMSAMAQVNCPVCKTSMWLYPKVK